MKLNNPTALPGWALLAIILLNSSISQITSDFYLPSLPAIAQDLSVSAHLTQFTLSVYMVGYCLAQWLYGPLSDHIGRRKPLLAGLLTTTIGSLLCWASQNIAFLFLGRFVQGLGAGAGTVLSRALLRDLLKDTQLAKYGSYMAISSVCLLSSAPIAGGYIQFYGSWRYSFAFLSTYSLLILILSYYYTPETYRVSLSEKRISITKILKDCQLLLKNRIFLRFTLCVSLTYAGILAWLTATPIVLQNKVGLSSVALGNLYLTSGLGFGSGALLNAKWVTQYGIEKMILCGLTCQLSAGILMCAFYLLGYINAYVIIAPIFLFMFGSSLVFPNTTAGALTPFPSQAGTASALFSFIQISGGTVSSALLAIAHDENQLPMGLVLVATAVLAQFIFRLLK